MAVKEPNTILITRTNGSPFMCGLGITLILAGTGNPRRREHCWSRDPGVFKHRLVVRCSAGTEGRTRLRNSGRSNIQKSLDSGSPRRWSSCPDPRGGASLLDGCLEIGLAGAVAISSWRCSSGILSQGSIWYPINLLGAGIIPSLSSAPVEQLRHFSGAGLIAGTLIHGLISILVGLLYAVSLPMFPRGATWRSGLVTPLLWSALVASTLGYINPTLNSRIDWGWFIGSQIAFGLVASQVIARTNE